MSEESPNPNPNKGPNINLIDHRERPKEIYTKSPTFATIPSDRIMIMVDSDTQSCTMKFYNKHIGFENTPEGHTTVIDWELRLEAKIPITVMNGVAIYCIETGKRVEGRVGLGTFFGPTGIQQSKSEEKKK